MRLYIPGSSDDLEAMVVTLHHAVWTVGLRSAHAVTAALRAELPDEDQEGLEYAAALAAADDSLAMIVGRPGVRAQRIVITVDVPDDAVDILPVADDIAPSTVQLRRELPEHSIVCVHMDEAEAAVDILAVAAAASHRPAGTPQEPDLLDAAIQQVTDRDLLWFDWSEVHRHDWSQVPVIS